MAQIPDRIKQLIETFSRNIDTYKTGEMNETQLRRQYIDPFFTELGWDVENKKGYASAYKDVSHEYSLKTKDVREAPDYCFRIGQTPKFFLEAKKPSVNVKEDIHPAFQVRSYAWSAKLPLSILTDFEEFAVYDCRIPPHKNDKASTARVMYFTYDQYIEKWDEITEIFSREAILKGSFDKYIESNKKKKGTAEVDSVFLDQMEEWRKLVARNIALRNPSLSIRELNFVVQKTIDRIIFLRICEDRGIEDYGQLMALQNGSNVYDRLKGIYDRADEKYNSGLFHFTEEKERGEAPDSLSHNLTIDDKVLKDIFKQLYYPDSPYEFSVLPADILGQVYEQFLGKIIRLTPAHQAVIEDKPEVKKAGGVYYTPTYIVDYIVQNTVGKLLEGKKLKDAAKLKILDPACGSGSFLIGAFQYLLNWHLGQYTGDDEAIKKYSTQKQPAIYQASNGDWLLTTSEKRRILLNNIYGVDIDSQAVEVTKLSLLLKVLEGESEQTISNQLKFFRERALPDLSNNIKCGNSLIGPDFYDQMEMQFLDDEERIRINVFDWKVEFKEIMDNGGFDIVIGNPPWGANFSDNDKKYLSIKSLGFGGNFDSYLFFIELAINLKSNSGLASFITPDTWIRVPQAKGYRKLVLESSNVNKVVVLPQRVFKGVSANCIIFILDRFKTNRCEINIINPDKIIVNKLELNFDKKYSLNTDNWKSSIDKQFQIYQKEDIWDLLNKIVEKTKKAEIFLDVMQGIVPYSKENHSEKIIKERGFHSREKLTEEYGVWIRGRNIARYSLSQENTEYLKYGPWLHRAREPKYFIGERILIQEITGGKPSRISACICKQILYHDPGIISCLNVSKLKIEYLLGVINSKLISWFHRNNSPKGLRKTFPKVLIGDIRNFPIKDIDLENDNSDLQYYYDLVNCVTNITNLHFELLKLKTPAEKTALQRQIDSTDKQIDQLVYQLYGLTEEEIKIVEGE